MMSYSMYDKDMKTYKNAKILIILSIVLLVTFAGCTGKENTIKTKCGDVKMSECSGPNWYQAVTKVT